MKGKIKNMKPKREKTKNNLRNKEGITLIALVITIIVLLILAAVSIATLTGQNGILTRANEAKTETEEAKEDELRRLTALEAATNLENTTHTDSSTGEEKTVTIPAGFAVSQVEGENTIKDGLVIIDSKGNEFVWVPVSQENFDTEFVRRAGYHSGSVPELTDSYGEADATGNNTNSEVKESETTQKEAQEMYKSVYDNEGFYIGRYETGKDNNENAIIQKGANVYNNVAWSRNGQMNEESAEIAEGVDGTKDGAIELARNFDIENNYTAVTSTLCYGVQWDSIMKWMEEIENPDASTSELNKYIQDSTGKGWYNNNYQEGNPTHQTGIDLNEGKNKVKNIYDLAGNVREWTMESYSTDRRICRGGYYTVTGFEYPVSTRRTHFLFSKDERVGFRVALYLNN